MAWQLHHDSLGLPLHFLCAPSPCRSESLLQAYGSHRRASAHLPSIIFLETEQMNRLLQRHGQSKERILPHGGKKCSLARPHPSTLLSALPFIDCKGVSPHHVRMVALQVPKNTGRVSFTHTAVSNVEVHLVCDFSVCVGFYLIL